MALPHRTHVHINPRRAALRTYGEESPPAEPIPDEARRRGRTRRAIEDLEERLRIEREERER